MLRHILTGCKTSLSQGGHLEAQPVSTGTSDYNRKKEMYQQCPPPLRVTGFAKTIPFLRTGIPPVKSLARMKLTLLGITQDWKMQVELNQKIIRNVCIQTQAGSHLVVNLTKALVHHGINCALEGSSWWSIWMQNSELCRHSSWGRTMWLVYTGAPGWGRV